MLYIFDLGNVIVDIDFNPNLPHSQTHPFPLQLISCGAKGGKNALYL